MTGSAYAALPIAVVMWLAGCAAAAPADVLRQRLEGTEGVLVVAHRACWRETSENSVDAIVDCIRAGVDMIEIDVRETADGHLMLLHDDTLDRTTNGSGPIADRTLAELASLRLRAGQGGPGARVTGRRIPTLEEALSAARGRILVNVDAKGAVRDAAFGVAQSLGMADQLLLKMTLTPRDAEQVRRQAFFGHTYFMPLVREENGPLGEQVDGLAALAPVAYEVIYTSDDQLGAACRAAAAQRARCWVNSMWDSLAPGHADDAAVLDPDRHWGYLLRLGVDMLQTDRPLALRRYLDNRRAMPRPAG